MSNTQTEDLAKASLGTVANAVELGRLVFKDFGGDALSATIDGQPVNGSAVSDLIAAKINVRLNTQSIAAKSGG